MQDVLAAQRYAQAMLEIAQEYGEDQEVEDELQSVSKALKASPELEKFLLNPYFTAERKRTFLEAAYRKTVTQKRVLNFLSLLLDRGRFHLIHEIAEAYKRLSDAAQGEGTAEIRSAVALSPVEEAALASRLEEIAGMKLTLKKQVDPSLIGGVVVKIRHRVLDGSVKGQLERMKQELTKAQTV